MSQFAVNRARVRGQGCLARLIPQAGTFQTIVRHWFRDCQAGLFGDRSPTATLRANQMRLWFASMACVLLCALRRLSQRFTQFASTPCGTVRLPLLGIGALAAATGQP
jgi:hypothetical protein